MCLGNPMKALSVDGFLARREARGIMLAHEDGA